MSKEPEIKLDSSTMPEPTASGGSAKRELKVDYKTTFKIGLGFALVMIFWTTYDFVAPLLIENIYGLSNLQRGIIMGFDNMLALFMMPLFGRISDKARGRFAKKYGRRTPFIIGGVLIAAVFMVFVPVTTLRTQARAEDVRANAWAQTNDNIMGEWLGEWWRDAQAEDDASVRRATVSERRFVVASYNRLNELTGADAINANDEAGLARVGEWFVTLRYDSRLESSEGFFGIGARSRFIGHDLPNLDALSESQLQEYFYDTGYTLAQIQEIREGNEAFQRYAVIAFNNIISGQVYAQVTMQGGLMSLVVYLVILLVVLLAMGSFRSPAVALMPDVTPKPLRSQANAVISLVGGFGGALAFFIYTVVLFFPHELSRFLVIFSSIAIGMLLILMGFMAMVKEKKLVERNKRICQEYGIVEEEVVEQKREKKYSPREWWGAKTPEQKSKFKSTLLILGSIWMWFIGWAAINVNLSIYVTRELHLSAGVASIISGVAMGVSAIAFIPVGILAKKIGRKKTVILGYILAIVSFLLLFYVSPMVSPWIMNSDTLRSALFAVFFVIAGFGMITANVNTLPMTVDLAHEKDIGTYTGYYYMATMSATAITPTITGLIMDHTASSFIFIYSVGAIAVAIVLMALVKHGDSFREKVKK